MAGPASNSRTEALCFAGKLPEWARLVCVQVGTKTAETLHDQTKQLERVVDDLDQIQFSLKKARQVIRDITRGIATDKWVPVGCLCWALQTSPAAQSRDMPGVK